MTTPDPLSIRIVSLLLKPAAFVFKLAKGKFQRKLWVYSRLKKWGLAEDKDDFDSVYLQTTYDLMQGGKNRNLVRLFETKEVRDVIKQRLYETTDWPSSTEIPFDLRNHKSLASLRHYNIDVEREILDFYIAFRKNVNFSRPPKDLESNERGERIEQTLESLKHQISENTLGSRQAFNTQLNGIYEVLIRQFNTTSAAELLKKVIVNIENSALPRDEQDRLTAKSYFMLGRCKLPAADENNPAACNMKSYELQPDNKDYQSRACLAYFAKGNTRRAAELVDNILRDDPENERAYVTKIALAGKGESVATPPRTKQGTTFRTLYPLVLQLEEEPKEGSEIYNLLMPEIGSDDPIPELHFDNIDFWDVVGRVAFDVGTYGHENIMAVHAQNYANNKHVLRANRVLKAIFDRIKDTELYRGPSPMQKTACFLYFYSEFLISRTPQAAISMADILVNYGHIFDRHNIHKNQTLLALRQAGLFHKMIEISTKLLAHESEVWLLQFDAYSNLNDVNQAVAAYEKYVSTLHIVGDIEAHNILQFSDFLIRRKKDAAQFYDSKLSALSYQDASLKKLIHVYAIRFDETRRAIALAESQTLVASYTSLARDYQIVLLDALRTIGEYQTVIALIETHHDWRVDLGPMELYSRAIVELKSDPPKLIEVLRFRRDHYPQERLLLEELKLYVSANHDAEIKAISTLGRKLFPQNVQFHFFYIHSLAREKSELLPAELTDDLTTVSFRSQHKFALAEICLANGKPELGLEIAFQETIANYGRAKIKDAYFHLLATVKYDENENLAVGEGTYVRVTYDGKSAVFEVNAITSEEIPLIKKLLKAHAGDTVIYEEPVTREKIDVQIVNVFDKYRGLSAKIAEDLFQSGISTGMKMRSFEFKTADIEEMNKTLIDLFGTAAAEDKIKTEAAFDKYDQRRLSFSELVSVAARGEILALYSLLTSSGSNGFRVLPLSFYEGVPFNDKSEFVVDLTVIPILWRLSTEDPDLAFPPFIVSQFVVEYLEKELADAQSMQPDQMALKIVENRVIPYAAPPGYKEQRIKQMEGLVGWVKNYCVMKVPEQRVLMTVDKPDMFRAGETVRNMVVDTTLLAHGRVLISDDLMQTSGFKQFHLTLSLEFFCKSLFPEKLQSLVLPTLIENHYVGITLKKNNLLTEYRKLKVSPHSTFEYCLECLPITEHGDPTIFFECVEFVKEIYSDQTLMEARRETAQKVFVAVLTDYPNLDKVGLKLRLHIQHEFALLQHYLPYVLGDFDAAWEIVDR